LVRSRSWRSTSAQLYCAVGLAVDSQGNLYIGDTGNNRERKVSRGVRISTIAGTGQDRLRVRKVGRPAR
jgi:hypothetical protein